MFVLLIFQIKQILDQLGVYLSEKEAADVIRPIVDAIRYCHSMGVVHRDLKPENLLYTSPEPDATIKISDFGEAKVISDDLMITACGTPGYVAPEILIGSGYDLAVDYWSIGVILYVLLCGYTPFYEESNEKLFELIKKGKVDFSGQEWKKISNEAKDLIQRLLEVDPGKRYKADQIIKHPWITGEKASTKDLSEVTEKLREFNARRKLRHPQWFQQQLDYKEGSNRFNKADNIYKIDFYEIFSLSPLNLIFARHGLTKFLFVAKALLIKQSNTYQYTKRFEKSMRLFFIAKMHNLEILDQILKQLAIIELFVTMKKYRERRLIKHRLNKFCYIYLRILITSHFFHEAKISSFSKILIQLLYIIFLWNALNFMDQQETIQDYQLVLQQFEQRQTDLIKNCPPLYMDNMMMYVTVIMIYFKKIPKIKDKVQQLFFIDLLFGYTRCYEIYNKTPNGEFIYQNRIDITKDLQDFVSDLKNIWDQQEQIQSYRNDHQINRLLDKLFENIDILRQITQNQQLSNQNILDQIKNTKFYTFSYKIGLSGLSSYDGTRIWMNEEVEEDPLETLCHETCHNITRYQQQIDCRKISPQKNQNLRINGKMVEAGFFFEHHALGFEVKEKGNLNIFILQYFIIQFNLLFQYE
ncbi:hypothetical protein pb186bvf_007511 [Paramecium bursaria]